VLAGRSGLYRPISGVPSVRGGSAVIPLPEVRPVRLIALERVAHPMCGSVLAGTLQSPAQVGADLPVSQTEVVDNRRRNHLLLSKPLTQERLRGVRPGDGADARPLRKRASYNPAPRGCGGIGRRARFRSVWEQSRGGSSPLIRIGSAGSDGRAGSRLRLYPTDNRDPGPMGHTPRSGRACTRSVDRSPARKPAVQGRTGCKSSPPHRQITPFGEYSRAGLGDTPSTT
jgi:hypothetical protein